MKFIRENYEKQISLVAEIILRGRRGGKTISGTKINEMDFVLFCVLSKHLGVFSLKSFQF